MLQTSYKRIRSKDASYGFCSMHSTHCKQNWNTGKTKRHAIKVLKTAQENEISAGKDPMGLAAAALYLSCVKNGEDKTQRDIAEAANVTEVTIRNRYKGLKDSQ